MKLTDRMIAKLPVPTKGNRIHFDDAVGGFGIRITSSGARSFILDYRNKSGRQRRYTIGRLGEWTVGAARAEAKELRKLIDQGGDPMGDRRADREAPTVADLAERFKSEHLPKKRPITQRDYKAIIEKLILPKLGSYAVAEVAFTDVDALHRKITKDAPYQANRMVAVASKMFSLSIKWKMRPDNPCKGIERNAEDKRERYLSPDEMDRLGRALTECDDKQGATIIGLLLLTGARSGEVRAMRWQDLDLKTGVWTKPASTTKQKKSHRVPVSAPALALLTALHAEADKGAIYVFPSNGAGGYRAEIKKTWAALCKAARLKDTRVHDLRHSYASVLASSGHSLPTIGKLLGHTNPVTTARYSHLFDDPLRLATERAGEIITNGKNKE